MKELCEKLSMHLAKEEAALLATVLTNAKVTEFRIENNEIIFPVSLIADLSNFQIQMSALSMLPLNNKTFPVTIDAGLIKINITTVKEKCMLRRPFLFSKPLSASEPAPVNNAATFRREPKKIEDKSNALKLKSKAATLSFKYRNKHDEEDKSILPGLNLELSFLKNEKIEESLIHVQPYDGKFKSWKRLSAWMEKEGGHFCNLEGVNYQHFYVVLYQKSPIGMFALINHEKLENVKILRHFYLDETFRGYGIGNKLMTEVKKICEEQKVTMLLLETKTQVRIDPKNSYLVTKYEIDRPSNTR